MERRDEVLRPLDHALHNNGINGWIVGELALGAEQQLTVAAWL